MKKFILLLFVTTLAFAVQPKSIHYSALGKYLVDQDGQRTKIEGHPRMTCYKKHGELQGVFQKARGSTIWIIADKWNGHGVDNWYVMIENPVCDLK